MHRERLLDNGVCTITFVKAPSGSAEVLFVTFDPFAHVDPEKPGFGEVMLTREGVDVLTVQKRKETWYQELSLDDFDAVAAPIMARYRSVVFYGSSAGAYAALYFGAPYPAGILALSPRISIHPSYPKSIAGEAQRRVPFRHGPIGTERPVQARHVAIVYDRYIGGHALAAYDLAYVMEQAAPAFPHADLISLPHTGHPCATALVQVGLLKPMALRFAQDGVCIAPEFHQHKKRSAYYMLQLSRWSRRHRRPVLAEQVCDRGLTLTPRDPELLRLKAELRHDREDLAVAADGIPLEKLPDGQAAPAAAADIQALLDRIATLRAAKKNVPALRLVEQALALPPADLSAEHRTALLQHSARLLQAGDSPAEALASLEKLLALTPDKAALHFMAARLLGELDRPKEALAAADRAIALDGKAGAYHRRRGNLLARLGRLPEAARAVGRAVALEPDNVPWRVALADLTARDGKTDDALQLLDEGIDRLGPQPALAALRRRLEREAKTPASAAPQG